MVAARNGFIVASVFFLIAISLSGVLPLWLDEIQQLMETRDETAAAMIANPIQPGSAPLGYLVQHAMLRVTGYSVRRSRLPSVIFGAGAVFIVTLLGAELGFKQSWRGAAIFAAFPMTLRYATESRIYCQGLFFSVVATLLYV